MIYKLIHNGQENLNETLDNITASVMRCDPGAQLKSYNVTDDDDETVGLLLRERIEFIPTVIIYGDDGEFLCKLTGFPEGDDIPFLINALKRD